MNMTIFLTIRLLLGILFLIAGVRKVCNIPAFRSSISTFGLLPGQVVWFVAWTLPCIECIAGAALIFGLAVQFMALLVIGLLIVFSGALVLAWIRQRDVVCGCFGESKKITSYPFSLVRNVCLITLACAILFASPIIRGLTINPFMSIPQVFALLFAFFLLSLGLLVRMLWNLWQSFSSMRLRTYTDPATLAHKEDGTNLK